MDIKQDDEERIFDWSLSEIKYVEDLFYTKKKFYFLYVYYTVVWEK